MDTELEPIVGNWYRHLDKGQIFQVVAFDEDEGLIELQHFDGDIEEINLAAWRDAELEPAEMPEDWTGPIDDVERDDLGYSDTSMTDSDWGEPLRETPRRTSEAWEDTSEDEEDENQQPREETWDPEEFENMAGETST